MDRTNTLPPPKRGGIHPMRICIAVLLILIVPAIACAQANTQALYQKVRSSSLLIATHALIYYGAENRMSDPRSLDAYQKNYQALQQLVEALGYPQSLQGPVAEMSALLPQLEAGATDHSVSYPDLLIGLMDADAEMKKAVASAYADSSPELSQARLMLRELSERIGDLLIANQARITRVVGEYSVAYEAQDAEAKDQRINELFEALKVQLPEHAEVLADQHRVFRFARGHLLGNNYKAVSGSAAFYLGSVIAKLDELAGQTAP
ncbi:hypothetical protein E8F20_02380 [Pseudomonas sp. BN415]|uniref:hypothetical protein n=1 Tax=Pseudomonas sp. BN415 TaxID=2567889 RepID=UPI002456BB6C|nr:hypothetical protein [Pseudomonas sp. BN415]MDH4580718.1 hypothetical protein [Pseudomonas sp. BN415]